MKTELINVQIEFWVGTGWRVAKKTSDRYWKRDLGYLRKFVPQDQYRVVRIVKEILVSEV